MARSPLIFNTPVGTFYAIDLGAGVCALVIHGDGGAQSYPLDAAMALRLQAWLASGGTRRGRTSAMDLQTVADLYQSDDAAVPGGRVQYVATELGISKGSANLKVQKAREVGLITMSFRNNGQAD